jgi:TPR repeat protein
MAKKKTTKKKATGKKAVKKKPAASTLSARLEKTIEKDFQAREEAMRTGAGQNEWIEKNCKRMKSWQEAAEAGDARGQLLYGLCYSYGHGVKENHKKAVKWFTASAEQENAWGQYNIGVCYRFGWGVKSDLKKAVEWLMKAAEQGNEYALQSLGKVWLRNPELIAKSDVSLMVIILKAVGLPVLRKRAGNGCESALKILGCLYLLGAGVRKNVKKGEELIRLSWKARDISWTREEAMRSLLGDGYELENFVFRASWSGIVPSGLSMMKLLGTSAFNVAGDWRRTAEEQSNFIKDKGYGMTSISDSVAESLSKHEGLLYLNGLTSLSDAVAESLSKHEGGLHLGGLTELSDAAAESLSKHEGDLYLNGLTSLSGAAAKSLSKHNGEIEIDLDNLPKSAAKILRKAGPFLVTYD